MNKEMSLEFKEKQMQSTNNIGLGLLSSPNARGINVIFQTEIQNSPTVNDLCTLLRPRHIRLRLQS
jgi:hypothetical protein